MAQYTEDWSGSLVGFEPVGWTKGWVQTGKAVSVIEAPDAPGGRALRYQSNSTGRQIWTMDAVDSDPDRAEVQIRVLIRINATHPGTTGNSYFGLVARASGSASTETGEIGVIGQHTQTSNRGLRYIRYDGGASTLRDGPLVDWQNNELYWLTITVRGGNLNTTLAPASQPTTILGEHNESAGITAAGLVGFFSFASANNPVAEYLWVGVGTGTDDAPYPSATLTDLTATATSSTTAAAEVSTNVGHGMIHWVVTHSATAPSPEQVRDGLDHNGDPASAASDHTVSATGVQQITIQDIQPEQTYYFHATHENAGGDLSPVVSSNSFDTPEIPPTHLAVDGLVYTDRFKTALYNAASVDLTVLSNDDPREVVYYDPAHPITMGVIQVVDPVFNTPDEQFTVVIINGDDSRAFPATVIGE